MEINLKLFTQPESKKKLAVKDMAVLAFMTALLLVAQVGFAFLPNIEVVSLLIIIYTLVFRSKTLYIIYAFAFLEGLVYGFGIWWFMYLYVWTILYIVTMLFRQNQSVVLWAVLSAFFGLAFGALCAIPYAVAGGIGAGIAWWGAGIVFDIIHGIGNFFITLFLFKPVYFAVSKMAV